MTFAHWLRQQVNRCDPIGDLARDAKGDRSKPRSDSLERWIDYLERSGGCDGAHRALREAWREWQAAQPLPEHEQLRCERCGGDVLSDPGLAMLFWLQPLDKPDAPAGTPFIAHKDCLPLKAEELSAELSWWIAAPLTQLAYILNTYTFERAACWKLVAIADRCLRHALRQNSACRAVETYPSLVDRGNQPDAFLHHVSGLVSGKHG